MASKSGNVFSDSCNGYVNILDPIPGTRTDNPILRKTEDGLEGAGLRSEWLPRRFRQGSIWE